MISYAVCLLYVGTYESLSGYMRKLHGLEDDRERKFKCYPGKAGKELR